MPGLTPAQLAAMRARAEIAVRMEPIAGLSNENRDALLECEEHYYEDVPALLSEVDRLREDMASGDTAECYAGTCSHQFCATVRRNAAHEVRRLQAVIDQARARLLEGGVCTQFEDCDHKACNTNYAVWSLLDATRAPEAGQTDG